MTDTSENERKTLLKEVVDNVKRCAELVIKQLEGEERESQLQELRTVMLEYCDLDNNWKSEKRILSQIERSLTEESSAEAIDEMYTNLKQNHVDADPHRHEWYLQLEKSTNELTKPVSDDCDIMDTEVTQSYKDPFTKQTMTDPVKNINCGHSYERITVLSMLQKKKQMKCPVFGCKFSGYFNASHLTDDRELLREIKRHRMDSDN